jgi:hypothetical protein
MDRRHRLGTSVCSVRTSGTVEPDWESNAIGWQFGREIRPIDPAPIRRAIGS